MKASSLHSIVYRHLFPNPRPQDPTSFAEHLTKNLVPEVRTETAAFYGHLDCAEARYPGLDYSHPPHRMRLGRFVWHRRLFRAFDELGLTKQEIAALCRWEGTKWARERYELEEGIKVIDTAGMEIPAWVEPQKEPVVRIHSVVVDQPVITLPSPVDQRRLQARYASHSHVSSQPQSPPASTIPPHHHQYNAPPPSQPAETYISELDRTEVDDDDESDMEDIQSVGIALNERLRAAAAARESGAPARMDEAWEQWMKEVVERGTLRNIPAGITAELLSNVASSGAAIQHSTASAVTGDCPPSADPAPSATASNTSAPLA